jgi:predicted amidohydrolase YtcJ
MQPLHANPVALDSWTRRLGAARGALSFAHRSLERAGARIAFGSDWPVVTPDVLRGAYCAVTRQTPDGSPPGGWLPAERISLEDALRHYTIDGAYASFEESEKGSLEPGKLADLVVLSDDIFAGPPETLLKTRVLLTLLGGREVFRSPGD